MSAEQPTGQEQLTPERTNEIVDKFAVALTNYTGDTTTRDRFSARLTDAQEGLFGGGMTLSVEHGASGFAVKTEYKGGFTQRRVIGREGAVFDDVVHPDQDGRITDKEALNTFEVLGDALYAEMYEQLATPSPSQGDLLAALDSLTELGVASPQIAEMMRISRPTIELYREVLKLRGERPAPPDRRGDVDAHTDQAYIMQLQDALHDADQQTARLRDENVTLQAANTRLEQDLAIRTRDNDYAFADLRAARTYQMILANILNDQRPTDEDFQGLTPHMTSDLRRVFEQREAGKQAEEKVRKLEEAAQDRQVGIVPEVGDRHEVDQTAALSLVQILSREAINQREFSLALENGQQIGMSEGELKSLRRALKSRIRSVLTPRDEDEEPEGATEEEVAAYIGQQKNAETDEEGPLAVALRGQELGEGDKGEKAAIPVEEANDRGADREEVSQARVEEAASPEHPEMTLQEIAQETRGAIDHLREELEHRLTNMRSEVDPDTVQRYKRMIDVLKNQRPVESSFSSSQLAAMRESRELALQEVAGRVGAALREETSLRPPSIDEVAFMVQTELPRNLQETRVQEPQTLNRQEVAHMLAHALDLASAFREAKWSGQMIGGSMQQIEGFGQTYLTQIQGLVNVLNTNTGQQDYRDAKYQLPEVAQNLQGVIQRTGEMMQNLSQTMQTTPEVFAQCRDTLHRLQAELERVREDELPEPAQTEEK